MRSAIAAMKEDAQKDTRLNYTCEWVERRSRGGLTFVNTCTYFFFYKLEEVVQPTLPTKTQHIKGIDLCLNASKAVLESRILLDKKTTIVAGHDMSERAALVLLQILVDFYIQISLISFTCNIVERVKIKEKSTTPKSKGLRGTMEAGTSSTPQ